ncbi:MAG: TRAP transporter large permease [Bacillota bacterium]
MDALVLFLGVFLGVSIILKVPVAFGMGLGTIAVFFYRDLPLLNIAQASFAYLDSFPLLAIPFFLLAGTLMEFSGISRSLLDMVDAFVGKVRGSIGAVTILGSMAFGVLTGSAMATISAIGKIMVPEMVSKGYPRDFCAAILASTCFLGILIPPSIPGIFYGLASGQKISEVWLSTLIPGILFGIGYCIVNYFFQGRKQSVGEKVAFAEYLRNCGTKTKGASAALVMPIIIFGGIYGGICTPTEAGALSAVYGVLYYIVKKRFRKNSEVGSTLWNITLSTAHLTGVVLILCIFAAVSGRAITLSGVSEQLSLFVMDNVSSPIQFLLIVNLLYLFMGTFIDINSSILLMTPLLMPSVVAMGIDPIHFGAISLVNLSVGYMTPPFATGIFLASKIANAEFTSVVKRIWPFIAVGLITVAITTYFPPIAIYIPSLLK